MAVELLGTRTKQVPRRLSATLRSSDLLFYGAPLTYSYPCVIRHHTSREFHKLLALALSFSKGLRSTSLNMHPSARVRAQKQHPVTGYETTTPPPRHGAVLLVPFGRRHLGVALSTCLFLSQASGADQFLPCSSSDSRREDPSERPKTCV